MSEYRFHYLLMSICITLATRPAHGVTVVAEPFDLDPQASAAVEKAACSDPYGVSMESAAGELWATGVRTAWIRCRPHSEVRGRPVFATTRCKLSNSQWTCEIATVTISFNGADLPREVRISGLTPQMGIDIVAFLTALPRFDDRQFTADDVRGLSLLARDGRDFSAYLAGDEVCVIRGECSDRGCTFAITACGMVFR
jgi:hypothetical protein